MKDLSSIGLEAISERTKELWYAVNRKYGDNTYTLAVNGIGEVVLSKGYAQELVKGNRNVQKALSGLLAK